MLQYTVSGDRPFMTIGYIAEQLLMAHGLPADHGVGISFDGETVTFTVELDHV